MPLYEPPIDPGLLVRATAAGIDLASVLQDVATPASPYRFVVMLQKAVELCGEVKSLGGALLSAFEKRDAEQLSLLRNTQETGLLKRITDLSQSQLAEAGAQRDALLQTRDSVIARFLHHERLLGVSAPVIPEPGDAIAPASEPAGARIQDARR